MKHLRTIGLAAIVACATIAPTGRPADAAEPVRATSQARFEGRWIDLSKSWEGATACTVDNAGSVCFRTEAQLDAYLAASAASGATLALTSTCSSSLRLYDGTSYSGSVLNLSVQYTITNLSTYGFDNRTSSYKVGACASVFYSGASGGGSIYPGNTAALAQSATMVAGWDNAVSSVYIG
jgi:hypothetical protein